MHPPECSSFLLLLLQHTPSPYTTVTFLALRLYCSTLLQCLPCLRQDYFRHSFIPRKLVLEKKLKTFCLQNLCLPMPPAQRTGIAKCHKQVCLSTNGWSCSAEGDLNDGSSQKSWRCLKVLEASLHSWHQLRNCTNEFRETANSEHSWGNSAACW